MKATERDASPVALMGALIPAAFLVARSGSETSLFNADSLFAPALYRDLFLDAGPLKAWSFPPPGFFVPDLAGYFALRGALGLFGFDFRIAVPVYGFLQYALLAGGLYFFARGLSSASGRDRAREYAAAFCTVLLLPVLAAVSGMRAFYLPLLLTHHGGTFALALWSSGCLLRQRPGWTAILTALGSLSDPLFLGFFVVPALVTLPVTRARKSRQDPVLLLVIFAGAVVGRLCFAWIQEANVFLLPQAVRIPALDEVPVLLQGGMETSWEAITYTPWWLLVLYGTGLLALPYAFVRERRSRGMFFALVAVLFSGAIGVAGSAVQGQNEPAARYLLPLLVFPLFVSFHMIRGGWSALVCNPYFALIVAGAATLTGSFLNQKVTSFETMAACLAEQAPGLRDGLASYVYAKPLDLYRRAAGNPYRINQIDADGGPRYWLNSAAWYGPGPTAFDRTPSRTPHYDFLLTAGFELASLQRRFGHPDRRLHCPDTEIWIYDRPLTPFTAEEVRLWRAMIGR